MIALTGINKTVHPTGCVDPTCKALALV